MKTRPSQQNKTNIFPRNNFSLCFKQECFPDAFLFCLPSFVIVMSYYHLSQHAKAATALHCTALHCTALHCTAEGLTFSDPIHKKSARNLNLYDFCHSPKKLAALSPFRSATFYHYSLLNDAINTESFNDGHETYCALSLCYQG
jgi:hypothetical protein